MKNQIIAKRYSRALFSFADEEKAIEQYGAELDGFNPVLKSSPILETRSGILFIPKPQKRLFFSKSPPSMELSPIMKSFLNLLIEKGRIQHLPEIADYYHRLIDEYSNIAGQK